MTLEIFIVCVFLYALFGPYVHAKAYEIHERARRMEIENDDLDPGGRYE